MAQKKHGTRRGVVFFAENISAQVLTVGGNDLLVPVEGLFLIAVAGAVIVAVAVAHSVVWLFYAVVQQHTAPLHGRHRGAGFMQLLFGYSGMVRGGFCSRCRGLRGLQIF